MRPPGPTEPISGVSRSTASQLGRLGRLVRKELNEILRDRRTIITLVLMPLLLYPLLSIAFQQFMLAGARLKPALEYRLGFFSSEEGALVISYLEWRKPRGQDRFRPTLSDPTRQDAQTEPVLNIPVPEDIKGFEDRLWQADAPVDLGIRVRNLERIRQIAGSKLPPQELVRRLKDHNVPLELDLIYLEGSPHSRQVLAWMERQCAAANIIRIKKLLVLLDPRIKPVTPIETWRVGRKNPKDSSHNILAALVPLILILMTITGAVYPAIDLTAGERERGTLEILVAAPVPRLGLLFAKYVTVFSVAVLTALANLVMMTVTLLATGLGPLLFGESGLTASVIVKEFALLLVFAGFFSAVLLIPTSFARSFKEGQAYLIPLMLVSLTPGMLAMKPDLALSPLLAITPLINVVLLARDLFLDRADVTLAVIVVLSTLLYAFAALAAAARIFGAEGVLYSEQGNWADLFRRPAHVQRSPTPNSAFFCLALIFPLNFLLTSAAAHWTGAPMELRVALLVVGTVLMFGGIPWPFAVHGRIQPASGFQLHRAPLAAFAGAVFLGLFLWPLVLEVSVLVRRLLMTSLGSEVDRWMQDIATQMRQVSPVVLVLAFAVVPAIFEELFFRGYLFSALRGHAGAALTIGGTALLFALFHIVQSFERFVPSTLLGLVLGVLCWQTRSVFPGMVLHALHNTCIIGLTYYEKDLIGLGWFSPDQTDVPAPWLFAGALGVSIGTALLYFARAPQEPEKELETDAMEVVS
jgi:ABC-2 type transport system permease protein/sodium transport system permease protein